MENYHINKNFDKLLKLQSKGDVKEIKRRLKEDFNILNKFNEGHNRTLIWEAVNSNKEELSKKWCN